eukprot:962828_1
MKSNISADGACFRTFDFFAISRSGSQTGANIASTPEGARRGVLTAEWSGSLKSAESRRESSLLTDVSNALVRPPDRYENCLPTDGWRESARDGWRLSACDGWREAREFGDAVDGRRDPDLRDR